MYYATLVTYTNKCEKFQFYPLVSLLNTVHQKITLNGGFKSYKSSNALKQVLSPTMMKAARV